MAYLPKPSIVRPPKNSQLCGRDDEYDGGGGGGGGGGDGGYDNGGGGDGGYNHGDGSDFGPGGPGGPGFGPGGPGFGPGGPGFGPGGPGFGPGGPGFGPGGPGFGPGPSGGPSFGPGPGYGPGGGPRPGGFSLASAYAPVVVAHNPALDDIEPEGPSTGKLLKGFIKSKAGIGLLVVVVVVAAVAGALAGGGGGGGSGGGSSASGGSSTASYITSLATFVPSTTANGIAGTVSFKQLRTGDATVTITVALTSTGTALIPQGQHGFHIHASNATGAGATACDVAGAHFNPQSVAHGLPTSAIRHVGDLGNVLADNSGKISYTFTDSKISLRAGDPNNVINRAIMLHAYMDDGGVGLSTGSNCGPSSNMNCTSSTTGNAGPRLACAAIV